MRPSLLLLCAAALAAPAALAQPPSDPVDDLFDERAPQETTRDSPSGRDTSHLPDAQERVLGWENSSDEPPPTPAEDPQVSITADLNRGVAERDMAIAAGNARAEDAWLSRQGDVAEDSMRQQDDYQAALAAHQRVVADQQAAYEASMAAWRDRVEACRRGVRDACVTWYREP